MITTTKKCNSTEIENLFNFVETSLRLVIHSNYEYVNNLHLAVHINFNHTADVKLSGCWGVF